MNTNPPRSPRHSEAAFRRYEAWIDLVVRSWPQTITLNPMALGLSVQTASARLRDAMAGYVDHGYSSTIPWNVFAFDVYPKLAVTTRGPNVLVGPAADLRTALSKGSLSDGHVLPDSLTKDAALLVVDHPAERIVHALCVLLDSRILTQPVKLTNPDKQMLDRVARDFDVAVEPLDATTFLLV